jgi:hypothetical protein
MVRIENRRGFGAAVGGHLRCHGYGFWVCGRTRTTDDRQRKIFYLLETLKMMTKLSLPFVYYVFTYEHKGKMLRVRDACEGRRRSKVRGARCARDERTANSEPAFIE